MTTKFMGLELETAPDVLVPRAETELLATLALELIDSIRASTIIDLGCGAGNLACAIASARPNVRVHASDLTDACVALTRRNVQRCNLGERVSVVQGDLFAALSQLAGTVDLIVCNPPYISTGRLAKDSAHLLENEPREAFDGGPYGLSIHQRVIREAPAMLRTGGWLAFEMGLGQERQLELLFARKNCFAARRLVTDAAGAPRAVAACAILHDSAASERINST